MLIFDPQPPYLRWACLDEGQVTKGRCEFRPGWEHEFTKDFGAFEGVTGIGYILYHGGQRICKPVSRLGPESLDDLEQTVALLPERNSITLKVAQYWLNERPEIAHVLLCETAFFTDLPAEAGAYAVPYEISQAGLRRYGGDGLFHEWVWERSQTLPNKQVRKVISVYLGDRPNIAAIADGRPMETTIGFTPVEGILSATSCGDVDPTIVFQLHAAGMSLGEIEELLSRHSGFEALAGAPCGLGDVVRGADSAGTGLALRMLQYSIIKYIGAFAATMGGVDAIAFGGPDLATWRDLASDITKSLGFLGVRIRASETTTAIGATRLDEDDSEVAVLCFEYDRWRILAEKAMSLLR